MIIMNYDTMNHIDIKEHTIKKYGYCGTGKCCFGDFGQFNHCEYDDSCGMDTAYKLSIVEVMIC